MYVYILCIDVCIYHIKRVSFQFSKPLVLRTMPLICRRRRLLKLGSGGWHVGHEAVYSGVKGAVS